MEIHFKQANSGNYLAAARGKGEIRYLVIHFTANNGDTAKNNADYFADADISTSAHYFVDENEVWQSVADHDIAWHCGTKGTYYHPYCRNANSIGIEMCSRLENGKYYFKEQTIRNAEALARTLMGKYGIAPDCVVRHYDVTHKTCPAPYVESAAAWNAFKAALTKEDDDMTADEVKQIIAQSRTVYKTADDVPAWGRATVDKLVEKGWLKGEDGALNLSDDLLRTLVINDRAGLYKA
ncbi:MAG: N-acetylmuramoyl-L-alanine amidase [Eubacteriales bacterium]|nr:N-acetylmuramoyl-L-alanine amidase [Eubacteriales bacterium]